jgi:hypothetical protein
MQTGVDAKGSRRRFGREELRDYATASTHESPYCHGAALERIVSRGRFRVGRRITGVAIVCVLAVAVTGGSLWALSRGVQSNRAAAGVNTTYALKGVNGLRVRVILLHKAIRSSALKLDPIIKGFVSKVSPRDALRLALLQLGHGAHPTQVHLYLGRLLNSGFPDSGRTVWLALFSPVCIPAIGPSPTGESSPIPTCASQSLGIAIDASSGKFIFAG